MGGSVSGNARAMLGPQYTAVPVNVSLSTSTARSTQLDPGLYEMVSDVDCFFLQGTSTVDALTTSHYLPAGMLRFIYVGTADNATPATDYVAAIVAAGTGNLCLSKCE